MATQWTTEPTHADFTTISGTTHYAGERFNGFRSKAEPVNGEVVTLGKSTFLKPTKYHNVSCQLNTGGPYVVRGKNQGNEFSLITAPGGFYPEGLMRGLAPISGLSSISKFNDVPGASLNVRNEIVTKALLKLADDKAQLGETLATFAQTARLFTKPTSFLVESLRSAWRDRDVRPFLFRTLRDIRREGPLRIGAQKYLEYVYGWKPLMEDIYGIAELLKEDAPKAMLVSGSASKKSTAVGSAYHYEPGGLGNEVICDQVTEETKSYCKIYGRIDPNSAGTRALNQLGLLNPASLLWELVPWSFVVDWVVPIGPALSALTAPAGLEFVSAMISTRTKVVGKYTTRVGNLNSGGNTITSEDLGTGEFIYDGYGRGTYSTWPIPAPWINGNPLSGDREFKALALAIANLRTLRL